MMSYEARMVVEMIKSIAAGTRSVDDVLAELVEKVQNGEHLGPRRRDTRPTVPVVSR